MEPWEQDRLILRTIAALNKTYESPYASRMEFPVRAEMPAQEREALLLLVQDLKPSGVPDTVAYLTEEELMRAAGDLEEVGYDTPRVSDRVECPSRTGGLLPPLNPSPLTPP